MNMSNRAASFVSFFQDLISPGVAAAFKNSAWLVLDKVARAIIGITVGAAVARHLGPEEYGQLAFAITTVSFFAVTSCLGLDGIVVRECSRRLKRQRQARDTENAQVQATPSVGLILGTAFKMRLIVGCVFWVVSSSAAYVIMGHNAGIIIAIVGGTLIFQPADTVDLWFQANSKSKKTIIAKSIAYVLSNILRVILILYEKDLIWFALAVLIESAVSFLSLIIYYRRENNSPAWRSNIRKIGMHLLKESWPFAAASGATILYMRIDQILIQIFLPNKDLGLYSAAMPFANTWHSVAMIMYISALPILSRLETSSASYNKFFRYTYVLFFGIGVVISVGVFLTAEPLISILLGADYTEASNALKILAFINIPVFCGYAYAIDVVAQRRSAHALYRAVLGAALCMATGLALIPTYGINGAAISALLGFITSDIIYPLLIDHKHFQRVLFSRAR
jgi:O-antigen/teichoic acid export membrane protein